MHDKTHIHHFLLNQQKTSSNVKILNHIKLVDLFSSQINVKLHEQLLLHLKFLFQEQTLLFTQKLFVGWLRLIM